MSVDEQDQRCLSLQGASEKVFGALGVTRVESWAAASRVEGRVAVSNLLAEAVPGLVRDDSEVVEAVDRVLEVGTKT